MFITNMMLTDVHYEFFFIMARTAPEWDLHWEMHMWYVWQTGAEHVISLQVTPADFSEEGSEEEGDREPFRDITNTLAFHV